MRGLWVFQDFKVDQKGFEAINDFSINIVRASGLKTCCLLFISNVGGIGTTVLTSRPLPFLPPLGTCFFIYFYWKFKCKNK